MRTHRLLALAIFFFLTGSLRAQMIPQTVSIQPGYTHQAFYSMNAGLVSTAVNNDWDLAFQFRGFAGSILINSKNNVRLWKAGKTVGQWSSMTTSDTTGILSDPANELVNSDTSWNFGAFNRTNNTSNAFDLGWGVYDFITHTVTGDSVFFIKIGSNDYRKLMIENLNGLSYVYTFRWANLDGSGETSATMAKSSYPGKFFGYFSLVNNTGIDREPAYSAWDLTFCQYLALSPATYKVTGILSGDSIFVAKAYPVDISSASPVGLSFNREINTIGYEWKSYDFASNSWTIADSTVFFVKDRSNVVWKMILTGFGGSVNGNFDFDKGQAVPAGISEQDEIRSFGCYPNPANDFTRVVLDMQKSGPVELRVVDLNGRLWESRMVDLTSGLQTLDLSTASLTPGVYLLQIRMGNAFVQQKLVKQ